MQLPFSSENPSGIALKLFPNLPTTSNPKTIYRLNLVINGTTGNTKNWENTTTIQVFRG
ncbi:hypothetical protein MG1_03962 [Candida albicans GC75]|nr:hypothetical protein MG1_03962 [Candida albicans GC75]